MRMFRGAYYKNKLKARGGGGHLPVTGCLLEQMKGA